MTSKPFDPTQTLSRQPNPVQVGFPSRILPMLAFIALVTLFVRTL
jgi:hypothetical protein